MQSGTRIGHYEVIASIGAGGMGEVFRARDTRLHRDVAVKVLPKDFVAEADRLRRFEQEAKTLAALNHPNILTVFDAGVHEGAPYLVSELLEGKTLRDEVNGAALPTRKATEYALQIAHGLAAAHGKGIIHRDLKPENLFVTKEGRVKILDFGLAKLGATSPQPVDVENDAPATIRVDAEAVINTTEPGRVMGTPAYMAPEQVRAEPADHRADIFAFGCVLFEMLSGTRAFRRSTPVESMNAVLNEEPADLIASNSKIPPALERVVRRCLEKSPERRFQSASDLAFAVENAAASSTMVSSEGGPRQTLSRRRMMLVAWAVAGLCLAGLLLVLLKKHPPDSSPGQTGPRFARKLELNLWTPGTVLPATTRIYPAISPDGRKIAYATGDGLWLRWLDQLTPPLPLAKGENIVAPFWSPQSTDVAYFDGHNLMRAAVTGTRPAAIATLPENLDSERAGGAWLPGDRLIFTTGEPALYEVPAGGGKVTTALAAGEGEKSFGNATALPGGRGVLFLRNRPATASRAVLLWTPDGKHKVMLETPSVRFGRLACSPTGHVLFDRWDYTRGIWAFPFSLETLEATGEPRRISEVGYMPSVSDDGTLVCAIGGEQDDASAPRGLAWVDRSGKVQSTIGRALPSLSGVRLSPDGQRAVAMAGEALEGLDIWLFDLNSGQALRMTQTPAQEDLPDWWDEGRSIVFNRSSTKGGSQVLRRPAQSMGQEEILVPEMASWTTFPSGKLLLGRSRGKWGYVSLADVAQKFVPLPPPLQAIGGPKFSPDGNRLAYRSPMAGPGEVYVVDFSDFTNLRQVSRGGGFDPQWHPNSSELFFLSSDGRTLMSARQRPGSSEFEAPSKVFDLPESINPGRPSWPAFYSVSSGGERFLMLRQEEDKPSGAPVSKSNAMVVENWVEVFRGKK